MKRIGFITSGRWDYSYLSPLFDDLEKFGFQCVWYVLGIVDSDFVSSMASTHFKKSRIVNLNEFSSNRREMSSSLIDMQNKLNDELISGELDYAVLLGDRAEIFAASSVLFYLDIPFAHLAAGDTTKAAFDDNFRHAISTLADIHFAFSAASLQFLIKTQTNSKGMHLANPPHLQRMITESQSSTEELSGITRFKSSDKYVLSTFHVETKSTISLRTQVEFIESLLTKIAEFTNLVVTSPNGDPGSDLLLNLLVNLSEINPNIHFFNQLGEPNYWKVLRGAFCLVGNSSSGVYEAPFLGTPVINIGERQAGRTGGSATMDFGWNVGSVDQIVEHILSVYNSEKRFVNENFETADTVNVSEALRNRILGAEF